MTVLLIVLILIAALIWLEARNREPEAFRLETQERLSLALRTLLRNGMDGSSLVVRVRGTTSQLVYKKYVDGPEAAGLRSELPYDSWSAPFISALIDELSVRSIAYTDRHCDDATLLVIEYGRDFGLAHLVCNILFERVMGVRIAVACEAEFANMAAIPFASLTGGVTGRRSE